MRSRRALARLAAVRPAVLSQTDRIVDSEEEDRILRRIIASDPRTSTPTALPGRVATRHRARRLTGAVAVAVIIGLAAYGVFALVRIALPGPHPRVATAATPKSTGPTLWLASYRFKLPADFATVRTTCAPAPKRFGALIPEERIAAFSSAVSAGGRCIEAYLIAEPAKPASEDLRATDNLAFPPVLYGSVWPDSGYVAARDPSEVALSLNFRAKSGDNEVVFFAHGLSASDVLAIARTGLPAARGSAPSCVTPCR
jgi:hypothetical protein